MVRGPQVVEFDDVEVVKYTSVILTCRVGERTIGVPPRWMQAGTTIAQMGDRGRLVLSREIALNLGLI